ncbi:hypothetical protein ACU4GD_45495 [Cupriavidus basilensis]
MQRATAPGDAHAFRTDFRPDAAWPPPLPWARSAQAATCWCRGCLALLAADWAQAGDAALLQRMLFPGLGEVLSVWGPLAFAGLFGWALRTARAL